MDSFLNFYKNSNNFHHALYLIEEDTKKAVFLLKTFLEKKLNINFVGNPDFLHISYDNFSIDNAREISQNEIRKDFSNGKKIFIIETDFITEEAQNSLLKVFEEPTEGTHFFIISPQDILLPTLRSRMQVFVGKIDTDNLPRTILGMNLKERLEKIKEITDGIKDEENTKQDAIIFLNQIERELYDLGIKNNSQKLKVCEFTRQSLYDRGAPIKMILENLVLSI